MSEEPRWVPCESDGPLLTMPPLEFAKVWGELVEAYHGVNGFGGDTAELYSYRFQRVTPTVHRKGFLTENECEREAAFNLYFDAARAFLSLLQQFCRAYQCEATIDGSEAEVWAEAVACLEHRFDHRAHVRIIKKGA